jgi:predicted nucleic acid-binding protein
MSVLDASAYVEALTSAAPIGAAVRQRLRSSTHWQAPALFPAEVLSGIRGLVLGGDLATHRADRARHRLATARIRLYPFRSFADRVWELRDNLTVDDAWYVALAEALETSLLTTDVRLADASGIRCEIDLASP